MNRFVYPIAGKIVFRQDVKNPLSDTFIYVEGLLYSDGSKNASSDHKWHVHEDIPGKDFFNWTGRCLSAGKHFNPYHLTSDERLVNFFVKSFLELVVIQKCSNKQSISVSY